MRDEVAGRGAPHPEIDALRREIQSLTTAERHFRGIIERAGAVIWIVDAEGRTTFVNREARRLLGFPAEVLTGASFLHFLAEEDASAASRGIARRRQTGQSEEHMFKALRRDGALVWLRATLTPLYEEDGSYAGSLCVATDITKKKLSEARDRERLRLQAAATLAGGVAHTFNNLMTGILGNAEILRQGVPRNAEEHEMLGIIAESAQRAGHLTRQLLAYARGGRYRNERLDLAEVCTDVLAGSSEVLLPGCVLDLDPSAIPWPIEADPDQMRQVVSALMSNAAEAIAGSGDGRISVTLRNVTRDQPLGALHGDLGPGRYVALSVRDTGPGMSSETKERIFEPFFSTKGYGHGLGLAAAHGIVRNHGGVITVDSDPGLGSTFTVYLPAADQ